jgi:HAD superfamily hydrolase (TIGR01459 family)
MVLGIENLGQIARDFDAIVFDQWGVLHDGTTPYEGVPDSIEGLKADGKRLAVLSNSGKRADLNRSRIASKGFHEDAFELVMTSGEALWLDLETDKSSHRFFPICNHVQDAKDWAVGLSGVTLVSEIEDASAILLMGLSETHDAVADAKSSISQALKRDLPVYCSNPDRVSPRADGILVVSPGELAHQYLDQGGTVHFYGKPHAPVFTRLQAELKIEPHRILMVGDSLEHDIAGAAQAGWKSLFVMGGLHAADIARISAENGCSNIDAAGLLARHENTPSPDYAATYAV